MWIKLYFVKILVKNIYRVFLYDIIVAILNFTDGILCLFFFIIIILKECQIKFKLK